MRSLGFRRFSGKLPKHYKISKHNAKFISGLNDYLLETKILNKKEAINSYLEINNNLMNKRPGVMKLTKKWAERRIEDLENNVEFKATLGGCIIERINQTVIITKEH